MLNNTGIDYVTNGIYVSEINGLAEKDNGPYSGWMYRQNGVIADEGYAARKLSDGDVIKWFYTDDYTKETGYENNWDKVNSWLWQRQPENISLNLKLTAAAVLRIRALPKTALLLNLPIRLRQDLLSRAGIRIKD